MMNNGRCVKIINHGVDELQWLLCACRELSHTHLALETPGNEVFPLSADCYNILGHNKHTTSIVLPL